MIMEIRWAALIGLILLSAFFSAAETSLTTFSRIKARELADGGDRRAALLLKMSQEKPKMLSAILVGNNLVNIAASALAATIALSIGLNVGVMTVILTLVILIFGEITPKNAAGVKSMGLALFYSGIIYVLMTILTPVIWIINRICGLVLLLLRIDMNKSENSMTEGELRTVVEVSHEDGVIESGEKIMINNVFDFGDSRAKDIMIPRIDVVEVELDTGYDELRSIFENERYTRIPVYKDEPDNVIGLVNMKDFLLEADRENFKIQDVMRDAYFTFEAKNTAELLMEMKEESAPMAMVLNEYGACEGIVTMEDLVEEIVGEIRDEYDDEEDTYIEQTGDREYVIEASVKLADLNDEIGTDLKSEDYDSVGGYIIGMLDRIPQPGETVGTEDGMVFEILEGAKNRIDRVKLVLPAEEIKDLQTEGTGDTIRN